MKDIIIKVLLVAIALSAFTFFIATALWTDSGTINDQKDTQVSRIAIPEV